ncbi:MAG: hypothetical protein EZS28_010994 [Streblomastix strix]|uniref:Uncharacterized protein n=1 Tax=Streblomastix strix TaxID=222440 RepID=A0A5J4WEW5_9EUKA|nr:MAG: hypothetical protein EZS28_010994 [Streblomastix strix]
MAAADEHQLIPNEEIKQEKMTKKQATLNTILLACSYCLVFIATETALHYMSILFGPSSTYFLGAYGFVVGIFALIMPHIQIHIGVKASFHLSTILCFIFIALITGALFITEARDDGKLPVICFMMVLIGSASYGIGVSMLWFAFSTFMDTVTTRQTRGTLVGLFYGIFYSNSPIGNLLAGILNGTKLKGSIINLIFTSFCAVGVLILIPLKTGKEQPGRYLPPKPYFKEMFKIAKTIRYYSVTVSFCITYVINGLLFSILPNQLPEATSKTMVGYAFAIGGTMLMIGSPSWGIVVDHVSKRGSLFINVFLLNLFIIFIYLTLGQPFESLARVVLFCITFAVYGFVMSSNDVNQFWLSFDTCKHNPTVFLQLNRFLGNSTQGIVSFSSIIGVKYPEAYLIILIVLTTIMTLASWRIDTHYVSFARISEEDLVAAITNDPTLLAADPAIFNSIDLPIQAIGNAPNEQYLEEGIQMQEIPAVEADKESQHSKHQKQVFSEDPYQVPEEMSQVFQPKQNQESSSAFYAQLEDRMREKNRQIRNIASTAHFAATMAEPGSILSRVASNMAQIAASASRAGMNTNMSGSEQQWEALNNNQIDQLQVSNKYLLMGNFASQPTSPSMRSDHSVPQFQHVRASNTDPQSSLSYSSSSQSAAAQTQAQTNTSTRTSLHYPSAANLSGTRVTKSGSKTHIGSISSHTSFIDTEHKESPYAELFPAPTDIPDTINGDENQVVQRSGIDEDGDTRVIAPRDDTPHALDNNAESPMPVLYVNGVEQQIQKQQIPTVIQTQQQIQQNKTANTSNKNASNYKRKSMGNLQDRERNSRLEEEGRLGNKSDKDQIQQLQAESVFIPPTMFAANVYRSISRSTLDQTLRTSHRGLPPEGSRPPITFEQLMRKQNPMSLFMGADAAPSAIYKDNDSAPKLPKCKPELLKLHEQSLKPRFEEQILNFNTLGYRQPSQQQGPQGLYNSQLPDIKEIAETSYKEGGDSFGVDIKADTKKQDALIPKSEQKSKDSQPDDYYRQSGNIGQKGTGDDDDDDDENEIQLDDNAATTVEAGDDTEVI